jgi:hypothetical protein
VTAEFYAPAPGADSEFDSWFDKAWEWVETSGIDRATDPIYASIREFQSEHGVDEVTAARNILARAFVKHAAKTFKIGEEPPLFPPELVEQAMEPGQVRELRLPVVPTEPYWYENPDETAFIEHHILARRALGAVMPGGLLITGPAGSGKTSGVAQLIDRMNRERGLDLTLLKMDCATVTDPQKWFGARHINKTGDWYEKSAFVEAVETGAVILLDDVKRLHPTIHNPIMNWLAGDETVLLSDLNVEVKRDPATVFIGTANEGAMFGGNHRMDYAMDERFPYRVERSFPENALDEIRIITSWTGCDEDSAGKMVAVARKTRDLHSTGDLRAPISTRTLVHAGWLVYAGYTVKEAMTFTAVGLYDDNADGAVGNESERERVKQIVDGKFKR